MNPQKNGLTMPELLPSPGWKEAFSPGASQETWNGAHLCPWRVTRTKYFTSGSTLPLATLASQQSTRQSGDNGGRTRTRSSTGSSWRRTMFPSTVSSSHRPCWARASHGLWSTSSCPPSIWTTRTPSFPSRAVLVCLVMMLRILELLRMFGGEIIEYLKSYIA